MQLQMRKISRKTQILFRLDGYHHLLYYHRGSYIDREGWLMLLAFSLSRSGSWSWSDGNCTPIYTWTNSARTELHLLNILHGRIKFYLPPHGEVRDENAKVREAATCKRIYSTQIERVDIAVLMVYFMYIALKIYLDKQRMSGALRKGALQSPFGPRIQSIFQFSGHSFKWGIHESDHDNPSPLGTPMH
ncbi:hypothetical protein AVEN_19637-1 [Araneus ventricosus]|uniref:Uncharacterized protein n=1 Tax=Araneus ventricosus TaxID=182803 RepID=A0A4Y2C479_ARAVE|nr:hypothetical protein AVEN_19637-1 [Araneus ventricosus]